MKKVFGRVSAVVIAFAVVLTAVVFDVPRKIIAAAEGTHSHKACGGLTHNGCTHEDIEFEPFPDDTTEILRGKSYYLTKDIELSRDGRIFVEKGVTNLCLNGHSIKKDGGQLIDINRINNQYAELNICDCKGTGKIVNTSDDWEYACISVIDECTFNLYGGTVDGGLGGYGIEIENNNENGKGGTANVYGGTVQTQYQAAIQLSDVNTALNVYDGEISSSACNVIYVEGEGSTVSVCGGKIIGSATKKTALVANGKDVYVTIGGGEVIGENYAAVECSQGTVEINGGEVKSQSTSGSCVYNTDTLNVFGGTVSCNGYYGIYNYASGTTTISGGTINSAGSAIYNAARSIVTINGGNINSNDYAEIYNYGTLAISDGNINGKGTYVINNYENADLRISGGTVQAQNYSLYNRTGGSADISGGNLTSVNEPCVWNDGMLDISGGEITSGDLNPVVNDGGTLSISGGSFGAIDSDTEVFIKNMGDFNLSGSPTFNNTSLWLAGNDNIGITGELIYSEPCKVWIKDSNLVPRIFTSGWSTYMGEKDPSDYFKSPYGVCTVAESDDEALLRRFMITFNANGGSCETSDTSVNLAGRVLQLPNAKLENHSFLGWFTAADSGEKVTADTVFDNDIVLYAHWSECTHVWSDNYESNPGQHWKVCKVCGEEGDKTNHMWNSGNVTTEPTCTEKGIRSRTCTECGRTKLEDIDAKGHTLTHVPGESATETEDGVKEHWHCGGCDKDFLDENGETEATADDLKTGKIEKEVEKGENAPQTELKTSIEELINAVLTDEEKAVVDDGTDIKIILTVEDATNNVSDEDKANVEAAIGNNKLGQYLNVELWKIIGEEEEKITETNRPITITFEIPESLRGSGRTYSVIRVHGDETTVLEDKDNDLNIVTIETDKFSTYALVYSEATTPTTPTTPTMPTTPTIPTLPTRPTIPTSPTESGNSDTISSGGEDSSAGESGSDSSDTTLDGSDTSSGIESSSTGESSVNPSSGTSSSDESTHSPSVSEPPEGNGNPATRDVISLVPLAAAITILMITVKRKKK